MSDISDFVPEQSKTVEAIYAHYKTTRDAKPDRGYLGASIIGHSCDRYLWFAFRACCKPNFSGRMYRLFETGDLAEPRFADNLRAIGCTVHEVDANGSQFAISAFGGHFAGHMDGCILGLPEAPKTWHVAEYKTHNDKNFKKLVKGGVEKEFPLHYCQMQVYMHKTGMKRALYLTVNKNDDDLHSERVRYNKAHAEALMNRAERIIKAQEPLAGISDRPDFWRCKFCDARHICFGSIPPNPALNVPALSCKQCCHATPDMSGVDGRWVCEAKGKALSVQEQCTPCEDHLVLPGIMPRFYPAEYRTDEDGHPYIQFEDACFSGGGWRNGKGRGCFSSEELTILPSPLLVDAMVLRAKDVFAATATGYCEEDILDRYPESDCETVWKGTVNGLMDAMITHLGRPLVDKGPIWRTNLPTHCVAEYEGGIIAIAYVNVKQAEIRKGKV